MVSIFCVLFEKSWPILRSWRYSLMFSSKSCIILPLHLHLYFLHVVWGRESRLLKNNYVPMYLIDPVSLIEGTIPSLNNVSFTWVHACQGTSQVALVVKNLLACWCRRHKRTGFSLWVRKILWRWKWQPTRAFLPGESMDRGAWWATVHRVAESDMTEVA